MKTKTALLLFFALAISATGWSEVFLKRLETSLQYEYLDPNEVYGEWWALNATYFREVKADFHYHLGATAHYRDEAALLIFGGIGKTWSRRLFSNFALSLATRCDYLPQFRFDADINLKLLKTENLVATLGFAYVDYHTDYEDIIWRYGLALYLKRLIFELMIFNNTSNPGKVQSSTAMFSIGYGEEGWQWTYLVFNFGQQAYYVDYEVIHDSNEITLKHRRWIKRDFGWFAALGYMQLGQSYEKYLFQFGLFWQYK